MRDQVWKDIFIFHTNMWKKNFFFKLFQPGKHITLFFYTFKTSVETQNTVVTDAAIDAEGAIEAISIPRFGTSASLMKRVQ